MLRLVDIEDQPVREPNNEYRYSYRTDCARQMEVDVMSSHETDTPIQRQAYHTQRSR